MRRAVHAMLGLIVAALFAATGAARTSRTGATLPAAPAGPTGSPPATTLDDLLASTPADSLVAPLRRFESARTRAGTASPGASAGEAALILGYLHTARGEYRPAAEALARAAARLDPTRKPEARYWLGLAWLALGETHQARAALEEVAAVDGPRRAPARLALAQTWELARRPERALEILERLAVEEPGEFTPAALERLAALQDGSGHPDRARSARERLMAEFPRSMEAASARRILFGAGGSVVGARPGTIPVVIGAFVDAARARSLAAAAQSSGFPDAEVVSQGQGLAAVHTVRIGAFPSAAEARRAASQAERALGVSAQIIRP
jgi:tetratricopeptide (TPR) repeat protein